ncbi:MAG: hypothetical protein U5K31_15175 [Balneolaceae bacterium]|nr:hypothetical protein [Balneolaceae bacterium]
MIIGSDFSRKNGEFLKAVAGLSRGDTAYKIPVREINEKVGMDRTEIRNRLEYLESLGYLNLETIGGPLLYGHVTITEKGLEKAAEIRSD